ncbi:hypothetical protein BHE74_00049683 [Ensete ventricosum]|nr:hypothetical protein BHE74_00049683 [Ensete ventricosum]
MAEELGVFVPYVGGVEYAHVLLPPLETLCIVEETCVRDKAVESLCRIGAQMKESDIVEWFIPLVKRLAGGEWFTARVSSCGLFHIAYPSATELLKAELRSMYGQLCQDDMPMVRRSAASNLGKFAATVDANNLKTDIMSIFEDLTQDGMQILLTVCNLSMYLPQELSSDSSQHVRSALASVIMGMAPVLGKVFEL